MIPGSTDGVSENSCESGVVGCRGESEREPTQIPAQFVGPRDNAWCHYHMINDSSNELSSRTQDITSH